MPDLPSWDWGGGEWMAVNVQFPLFQCVNANVPRQSICAADEFTVVLVTALSPL
jgi:hypothetical protein